MQAGSHAVDTLDATHRDALVVLALDAERAMSRSRWQERVADSGVVDDRGRKLNGPAFKAIVDAAVACGAAIVTSRNEHVLRRPWLVTVLEDAHRRNRLAPIALNLRSSNRSVFSPGLGAKGELLAALASGDAPAAARAALTYRQYAGMFRERTESLVEILGLDVPLSWIALLEPGLRLEYLNGVCHLAFLQALPLGAGVRDAALQSGEPEVRARIATLLSLAGDGERARAALEDGGTTAWERGARAFAALTEGRLSDARRLFAEATVGSRKQRVELPGYLAVFDLLLTVTSDSAGDIADVARRMEKAKRQLAELPALRLAFEDLVTFRQTGRANGSLHDGTSWLENAVSGLRDRWARTNGRAARQLAGHAANATTTGYAWLVTELDAIRGDSDEGVLVTLLGRKEGWELALDALQSAAVAHGAQASAATAQADAQLWWTLTLAPDARWVDVEAHLVTRRAAKGKKVSLERALHDESAHLEEHDRRIVETILAGRERGYYGLPGSVLLVMVGHPRIRDVLGRHVQVELGEAKIHVTRAPEGAVVRFVPPSFDDSGVAIEREGESRIVVYRRTAAAARILQSLPPDGLKVPAAGLARLSETLAAMGGAVAVDAADSFTRDGGASDPRIHVQLFRAGQGLRARLRVVPAGSSGPALRPGAPPAQVIAHTADGLVRLSRDLEDERKRHAELFQRCATLASLPQEGDDLIASDLETCLELLVELRDAEADVVLEWPAGQPLRAPSVRGASSMHIRVQGDKTWLSVDGHLRVDERRVVEMREVLAAASRAVGRFLPIGDGEYVALTEDVRKKLEAVGRLQGLGKEGRVSTALLPAMEGIFDGVEVSFSETLQTKRDALQRAAELQVRVPRDLAAELRDYQRDGFVFLARRAEAGLGACLADDMGLGKTVQALALLLLRRKLGPALVVAPTSVCRNWEDEARKFAPALSLHRLAEGDRAACVEAAGRGDVVIASYGLLASEAELLAGRTWGTIIFDEAHALKNASTRRWTAAREMKAGAIIALTGTPVENHAGELHALFELLVPGMLGSRAIFDAALGTKIAAGDRAAAALLRQLVRPFVLRRTKAEVLTELPPKTELLHVVSATPEHRAFYEAVRRRALEKVEAARTAGGARAGRARIEILAEITRLRRAAIDPRLVGGSEAPAGSKLDALVDLVLQLREEGRRALVFSQFLEVLDLSRQRLEERGIECRRLDGTMSQAARAAEVLAFQAGTGDVFLMSLKAGGVGMNLTAADVVILLDPWWNPAVEDQAAGRAHRMGQSRPVTVARIVTEGTIEEKVLALHAKKRQLFDDLVMDADGGGTLDMDLLTSLLA